MTFDPDVFDSIIAASRIEGVLNPFLMGGT